MWQQRELWDGTYTFNDWLNAIEMIEVKQENEGRYYESIRREQHA